VLLDRTDHRVMALRAWGEKPSYGKNAERRYRSTFLVGPKGVIKRRYK